MIEAKEYISPGAMLKAALKDKRVTQKQLADTLSMMPSHISEIASNKRTISVDVATKFNKFFDIPAKDWLDVQTRFRLSDADDAEEFRAAEKLAEFDEIVSIKTLLSRIGKEAIVGCTEKLNVLRKEFGINSVEQLRLASGFFRKSEKTGQDDRMVNTWTFLARRESRQFGVVGTFDRGALNQIGRELSKVFHRNEHTEMMTANILSSYGIRFGIVKKVDHASIDGYSFVEGGIPAIVVTKRFDRIDNFAFTVLHELYHICKHLTEEGSQRLNIGDISDDTKEEKEANEFALNTLLPESIWDDAPKARLIPHIIQKEYTNWAKSHSLNEWIVLGRISHDLGMYQMAGNERRSIN